MNVEFEIKILDVDIDQLRNDLSDHQAKHIGKYYFKRYIYKLDNPNAWIRLRTDGSNHTLTYKHAHADEIDGVEEIEVNISDFEKTRSILDLAGLQQDGFQENSRDLYSIGDVEISIDEWPQIPAFVEIEGKNKEEVAKMIDKLCLKKYKATSKPVSGIYDFYCIKMP